MADHRAEQILAAIETLVTGLTTTDANVTRDRIYDDAETALPALSLFMGPDVPTDDDDELAINEYIDCELEVNIEAAVQAASGALSTTLNQIRKEIVIALQADHTLGLAFVHNIKEGNSERPELTGDGKKRIARQTFTWFVKYRRSRTDASA